MTQKSFNAAIEILGSMLAADARDLKYKERTFWKTVGTDPLDIRMTCLADFYIQCNASHRAKLRVLLHRKPTWHFVAYVRRVALLILSEPEEKWLNRGLAIASLENAEFDFRDSIVSLVILRAAAEKVGLDPVPYFNAAIVDCDPAFVSTLENARDHKPKDVRDLLRMFGPPQLTSSKRPE
jgi:hypothetical protein